MSYEGTLEKLHSLSRFGVRLDLDRITWVLDRLGRPQDQFQSIHIAGTNGKGSTAAMIAACLRAAGYRVGLYTSPHLCRYTERIQIDGREIPHAILEEYLERSLALVPQLTFFEASTAVAFSFFAAEKVDLAVVETGLGGRLDATNVLRPRLSILTTIDLDHLEVLGPDLIAVAQEKAGIIKQGIPVISAAQHREVEGVLRERCASCDAKLWFEGRDFQLMEDGAALTFRADGWTLPDLEIGLAGSHQLQNAALCLCALSLLEKEGWIQIDVPAMRRGLVEVRWPGRFERIGEFLLDGAHNPCGARALARALDTKIEYCLIMGILAPRDPWAVLEPLLPHAGRFIFTHPRSPRALPVEALAKLVKGAAMTKDLRTALELVRGDPRTKIITGSLYLVGEARAILTGELMDPLLATDPLGCARGSAVMC